MKSFNSRSAAVPDSQDIICQRKIYAIYGHTLSQPPNFTILQTQLH